MSFSTSIEGVNLPTSLTLVFAPLDIIIISSPALNVPENTLT